MVHAHSSTVPIRPRGLSSGAGALQPALDALDLPLAILDRCGDVVAANEAWRLAMAQSDDGGCSLGDNYLDWRRDLGERIGVPSLPAEVSRVLCGAQDACDQAWRFPRSEHPVRERVRRMTQQTPACFLVSHETVLPHGGDDLEERVEAALIQERERLAAELHDCVGQDLVCLGLDLARLRRLTLEDPAAAAIAANMADSLQHVHAEIRTLSFLLQPPWLEEPEAFEKAIRDLVGGFSRRAGLGASVVIEGVFGALSKGRELALFRILQEALVNVHRHARADHVDVELFARGEQVILKVRDNGRGIAGAEGAAPAYGVGLRSIRGRLRRFGGDLRIVSTADGTTLTAQLPG